jgi:hypothetical protein
MRLRAGCERFACMDRGRGQGKRFGARVHYLFAPHRETIYLMFVYRKGVQNLLTSEQREALCRWVRAMKPA